jgi:hypothetical protein
VNNHLVDAAGKVIAVPTEADAFRLAATPFVPPERRDEVIASMGFGELLR